MRLEWLPVILGVVVLLVAVAVVYDAFAPQTIPGFRERRRRPRAAVNPQGQALMGAGMVAMAVALIGRDTFRYGTIAVLAGALLLLVGGVMNRAYLKEALLNRGASRRRDPEEQPPATAPPSKSYRIR